MDEKKSAKEEARSVGLEKPVCESNKIPNQIEGGARKKLASLVIGLSISSVAFAFDQVRVRMDHGFRSGLAWIVGLVGALLRLSAGAIIIQANTPHGERGKPGARNPQAAFSSTCWLTNPNVKLVDFDVGLGRCHGRHNLASQ